MFNRIDMHVIHVRDEICFVANQVLPITPLPNATFPAEVNPIYSYSTCAARSASRERSPRINVTCPLCSHPLKRSTT